MRIRIVEQGPSRYPVLGDCPCGRGSIRTVSKDGHLLFFQCGLKTGHGPACGKRFDHSGGVDGQILCATEDDPTPHDFGHMITDDQGVRYFESHLPQGDRIC